ncbi:unnamed protein product, partial [Mesorhabditis spiculigera]
MISWCTEKYRCTRCPNNDNPVDDILMKRREFENDTGRLLAEVDFEVFRENMPRLINCIRCYQKHHFFNDEPVNTWIALEEAQSVLEPEMSSVATMAELDFIEHIASDKLVEMIDKMREGKEVTVDEREKWVKKAIERKMIPAEFTSEYGFDLYMGIRGDGWKTEHRFVKGKTDLQKVYCSFIEGLGNIRKENQEINLFFISAKSCEISRMINILHAPIFRGVLSKTSGCLALNNSQEYPSEMTVYEWAGVWKQLTLGGDYRIKAGINFSSFVIRIIQKLLNGGTSGGVGYSIHRGPLHLPFIGEKQRDFEEKYNVRIALITHEKDGSTSRYLRIFDFNKHDTLSLRYGSDRYFNISMGSPSDSSKYEQMQLGIIAKDETMKVTSEKINESTYKRTMEKEGGKPLVWTANCRPTFDDINCFDYLKGPLPDMSYCTEFDEMC